MKLLVVSQYFWPENFRINDLVEGMVARGHEVTVLTGQPNYPKGQFFDGYGWGKRTEEEYRGARVVRSFLLPRGNAGGLRLILNYLSFALFGAQAVWRRLDRNYDAIFVFEVSPITVGIPAIIAKWRSRAPIFFWVLDLWPESLVAAGGVRSPRILRMVDCLVRWIYRHCERVLVQSRGFIADIRAQGVADDKMIYFPSWGEEIFKPLTPDQTKLPPLGEGFKILFAGNIGQAQDFGAILDAAEITKHAPIEWLIVGDGRMASWAKQQAAERGLSMRFLGQHPLESMPNFYAAADALLLPLKKERIFSLTIPGKLQSYLACAKPVLAMLDGEGARIVEEAGAGMCCPAGDAKGLAENALKLAQMQPQSRLEMGQRGRAYYEANFDRNRLFDMLENSLMQLVSQRKSQ